MGIVDRLKKYKPIVERIENPPDLLNAKLLFFEKPVIDAAKVREELNLYFTHVDMQTDNKVLLCLFPDYEIELKDVTQQIFPLAK